MARVRTLDKADGMFLKPILDREDLFAGRLRRAIEAPAKAVGASDRLRDSHTIPGGYKT